MAFKSLFDASNASPFKFEAKGTVLEGWYMGSFDFTGDYGPTKKHIFETKRGAEVVFGQKNLMQQLPSAKVGAMVRITYTDDKTTGKGRAPMKLFKIEQDLDNVKDVGDVNFTPAASDDDYQTDNHVKVGNWSDVEESDVDAEEEQLDTTPVTRAQAPRNPVATPNPAQQSRVQALLSKSKRPA